MRHPAERVGGLTLIEVMIYTSIVVLITAPISGVVLFSIRSTTEHDSMNWVSERHRTSISKIEKAIRPAIADSMVVSGSDKVLQFTLSDGFDGTNVIKGDDVQLKFSLAPGEQKNGADDNGNGLIDEGQLALENLTTGEKIGITEGVDLNLSTFTLAGGFVSIQLAISAHIDRSDSTHTLFRTFSVAPRN